MPHTVDSLHLVYDHMVGQQALGCEASWRNLTACTLLTLEGCWDADIRKPMKYNKHGGDLK